MQKHKKLKKVAIILAIIAVPLTLLWVDWFIYPLQTTHPNFSDVNRVFDKMTFPSDWKVVGTSENKGTAGRACPIESESLCFHKSATYSVSESTTNSQVETILKGTGCPSPSFDETKEVIGGNPYTNYVCSIDAVTITGTLDKKIGGWTASFTVSSR